MTDGLLPLLWQCLDADADARAEVAALLGVADTHGQALVGEGKTRAIAAFRIVARRPAARHTFQEAFAALDADRANELAPVQAALAELLHRGHASFVLSLNWDTLLERAHQSQYGRRLRPDLDPLAKPHGDAAHPEASWTLPGEVIALAPDLVAQLKHFADERPRVLLIIGYSKRDEWVVRQIIRPLEDRWASHPDRGTLTTASRSARSPVNVDSVAH